MQRPVINIGQLMTGSFLSRLPYHKDGTFIRNINPGSATQMWHVMLLYIFLTILSLCAQHRGRPTFLYHREQQ